MMKLGSLFDGIGGALLSAAKCGITPVWASEIEPFPIRVTKHHFPDVTHYGDITEINGAEIEPVDIIVGGSPCQDLSVAGKREGLAGERSGLFMEQIRIVKEMLNATNGLFPRYMVWENVAGAFSSNKGDDFRIVLEEIAKITEADVSIPRPDKRWAKAGSILGDGWSISWRTFDAQFWGVPQRRRRIYLVADFRGSTAPEILFESESVSRDITEGGEAEEGVATDAERSSGAAGAYGLVSKGNGEAFLMEEKHMSLTCGGGQAGQGYPAVLERRTDDAVCYSGENVTSPTNKQNPKPGDPCHTLGTDSRNYVCYDMSHSSDVIRESGDKTPALLRRMGTGGNQVPLTYSFQRSDEFKETDVASTQAARQYKSATDLVLNTTHIRRLTPLECERLQGFPDDWTSIDGASDTARYKALGNSFAMPNIRFVIESIKEHTTTISKMETTTEKGRIE